MTVAVFVASKSDAVTLIPWGVQFALSDHAELLIVCPRKSKGKRGWDALELSEKDDNSLFRAVFDVLEQQDPERVVMKAAIAEGSESTDLDRVAIETRELIATSPPEAFVEEIERLDVDLVLLPALEFVKGSNERDMLWHQKLFTTAHCDVAIVNGTPPGFKSPIRILVASQDETDVDSTLSLNRGCQLAKSSNAEKVTVLYVRPDDDVVATQVAEKHLRQLIKNAGNQSVEIAQRTMLADSLSEGINQMPLDQFDLVLVGTRHQKTIRSLFRNLDQKEGGPSFAMITMRAAIPLTIRVWDRLKSWVRSKVPQIGREYRVSLVDRLQNSSRFDFDFIALISLSTLIAACGLARDSGAVVIGAMLVAPLMTPLIAIGFALVQGNLKLIRSALRSLVLGFAVALGIGVILGLMVRLIFEPNFVSTSQMLARESPHMLDLLVALASGIAGAYALGRPNLISALPGVAIAAALVPPIATIGLALTNNDFVLAGGASLLFLTNIVAIVLGTAITFWSVGISTRVGNDRSAQTWPRYWFLGFVVVSFLLAAWISHPLADSTQDNDERGNIRAVIGVD